MKVQLVSVSQPAMRLQREGIKTPGDLIAYTARVSNPDNQFNTLTAPKLVKYLVDHSHWSPLEMVSITMEIETTRDIARQILRHRSFSFQEFSQRYADPTKALGFEVREARLQDIKNRQNSIETEDATLHISWAAKQQQLIHECGLAYKWAIENGIAKEVARAVLPEGLTSSRLYMAGTVRSWYHYCLLRTDRMIDPNTGKLIIGTQKEHRVLAQECWNVLSDELPILKELIPTGE
jgi:thymidylate synthase (FAD)